MSSTKIERKYTPELMRQALLLLQRRKSQAGNVVGFDGRSYPNPKSNDWGWTLKRKGLHNK